MLSNKNSAEGCRRRIYLYNALRELWSEHVVWTRMFILSAVADSGDLQLVTERLLRNPKDFAYFLRRYYGTDKSKQFAELLAEHLLIAANLVAAAKVDDANTVRTERAKWYKNADMIADFLFSINPYWNRARWQNMLYSHSKMVEDEATYRLTSRYAADISNYDDMENQALNMADYMVEGIIRQFNL